MTAPSSAWNGGSGAAAALFVPCLRDTVRRTRVTSDDARKLHAGERPKSFLVQHEFGW